MDATISRITSRDTYPLILHSQAVEKPAEDFWDRAAGNVCKGLRPLKVNCPKGKRSWPGPCAFNQYVFSNFFKSLKIRTAWRKDFFDTLWRPVWPPGTMSRFAWGFDGSVRLRAPRRGRCPHRPAPSLPLVPKGRWHGEAVTEGIRAYRDRRLTIPQSRCA